MTVRRDSSAVSRVQPADPCRRCDPRAGCHGRKDAAHFGSSPPFGRELENGFFSSLLFSILSSERFSSHLLSKTATIGVVSPRWSSWSHWAAECVWKYLCVPSDSVFPQTYSPARFIHLMSSQIAFAASMGILGRAAISGAKLYDLGLLGGGKSIRCCTVVALNGTGVFWAMVRSSRA